jgi:hypothetical protein
MKAIWKSCLALLLASLILTTMVACGGSVRVPSTPATPPPSANNAGYSNASLSGNYVFTLRGVGSRGEAFVAVGVFTADGAGKITSGQQDVNDVFSGLQQQAAISSGTYSVGTDGRGQATLNFANGNNATFSFVLVSPGKARIIEMSNFELSSGLFELQTTPPSVPSGSYVLRMDGMNNVQFGQPVSRVGLLTAAAGSASGVLDENYNGTFTATVAVPSTTISGFSATTGRGTMQFTTTTGGANSTGTTIDLVFYVVSSSRIEFLSMNVTEQLSGYADLQSGTFITNASVSNPYVYEISGYSVNGFITETGSFTLNGSGAVDNGLEDFVDNGNYSASVPFSSTSSYAADGTNNGRFTGSFVTSGRTVNFVLWFSSSQNAVLMAYNTATTLLESGLVTVQPAVPTAATITSNYAFHLGGTALIDGQLLADGVGTFTGLEDLNQEGNLATGISASGTYSVVSGRGTGTIGGIPVVLYPASSSTTYVMSTNGNNMLIGSMELQQH